MTRKATGCLSVQRSEIIGENAAATILFHTGNVSVKSEGELEAEIAFAFDGKVRLLAGSAHRPSDKDGSLVMARVALNRDVRPYDTEGVKGMTATTANVFRDEDDNIWVKQGEGESAMLVRQSDDDLETIISTRQGHSVATASAGVVLSEAAKIGEAVVWYDDEAERIRFGIKIAAELAFSVEDETVSKCEAAQVIGVMPHTSQREIAMEHKRVFGVDSPPLSPQNFAAKANKYFGILYGRSPGYYQRLVALMRSNYGRAALVSAR